MNNARIELYNKSENMDRIWMLFILFMILILILRFISNCWIVFLCVFAQLSFLVYSEKKLKDVMSKMITSSSYFSVTPVFFVPLGIVIVICIAISSILSSLQEFPFRSVGLAYFYNLSLSLNVYLLCSSLKSILIGTGIITFKHIRRGFFGVFQRFFVFLSNSLMGMRWVLYISHVWPIPSLLYTFKVEKSTFSIIYIVMKCLMLIFLLWDFGFTLRQYSSNSKSTFHPVSQDKCFCECVICQDKCIEPMELSCHHIFCFQCLYQWTQRSPTCPLCRTPLTDTKKIEFADGSFPLISIFITF